MKKALTIIFLTLASLMILDSMDAFHALAMFILAGIIPGTSIAISASNCLGLFALLIGFVMARVSMRLGRAIGPFRRSIRPLQ